MNYRSRRIGKAVFIVIAIAVFGWAVMTVWNWVIPAAFVGARSIDFLHALGLLVLSRMLFGGFRRHGGWHKRRHWRKWEAMTPEERESFQTACLARSTQRAGD